MRLFSKNWSERASSFPANSDGKVVILLYFSHFVQLLGLGEYRCVVDIEASVGEDVERLGSHQHTPKNNETRKGNKTRFEAKFEAGIIVEKHCDRWEGDPNRK